MMEMYLQDLNATEIEPDIYEILLSNGEKISVSRNVKHNGTIWEWKVNDQLFSKEQYALNYLKRVISEKLTGYRVLYHSKQKVPEICGVNGAACRRPGKCNSALCITCPVAEKFFADKDGVTLVYAIEKAISF